MSNRRRIVLTGVSRGLGLALLEEFIRLGHTVYGCARIAWPFTSLPPDSHRHTVPRGRHEQPRTD